MHSTLPTWASAPAGIEPRPSDFCSADFSLSDSTSNATFTAVTPATVRASRSTASTKWLRIGQPAVVSETVTSTVPSSAIAIERTIPSSMIERRSSGSITRASAVRISSWVGICPSLENTDAAPGRRRGVGRGRNCGLRCVGEGLCQCGDALLDRGRRLRDGGAPARVGVLDARPDELDVLGDGLGAQLDVLDGAPELALDARAALAQLALDARAGLLGVALDAPQRARPAALEAAQLALGLRAGAVLRLDVAQRRDDLVAGDQGRADRHQHRRLRDLDDAPDRAPDLLLGLRASAAGGCLRLARRRAASGGAAVGGTRAGGLLGGRRALRGVRLAGGRGLLGGAAAGGAGGGARGLGHLGSLSIGPRILDLSLCLGSIVRERVFVNQTQRTVTRARASSRGATNDRRCATTIRH